MKSSLALLALLLGSAAIPSTSKAQGGYTLGACIEDNYGYVWNVTVTHEGNFYTGVGTVEVGAGYLWDATITYDESEHTTNFTAINPQADGCVGLWVDYFTYKGRANAKKLGQDAAFNGRGSWKQYCSGSVINTGDWTATDCASAGKAITPNGPAKAASSQKVWDLGVCINDDAGYVWTFTAYYNDHGTWFATGTVDLGDGSPVWDAKGKYQPATHATEFEATNLNPDGCTLHTDAFRYEGTAKAKQSEGVVTYNGSGTWTSYCGGSDYATGTWSATDCNHKSIIPNLKGAGKASDASFVKVSPNPIMSQANVSYAIARAGQVNITVYNSMQQAVKVLVNGYKNAGNYSTVWDTRSGNLNSGIYRVVAVVNGKTYSTTVQVIK